jgi:hypothetical protein
MSGAVGTNLDRLTTCQLRSKVRVAKVFQQHSEISFPSDPSLAKVAHQDARVSRNFTEKVISELENDGFIDLELTLEGCWRRRKVLEFLDIKHKFYILGLRAENLARSNSDYCNNLFEFLLEAFS